MPYKPPRVTSIFKTSLLHFSHAYLFFCFFFLKHYPLSLFVVSSFFPHASFFKATNPDIFLVDFRRLFFSCAQTILRRPFSSRAQAILIFLFRYPHLIKALSKKKTILFVYFIIILIVCFTNYLMRVLEECSLCYKQLLISSVL